MAISIDPNLAGAYRQRGDAYKVEGDLDKAMADYDKAIQLDPKEDSTYFARAILFTGKEDISHAIADLSKAIELNPQNTLAYSDRGFLYSKMGNYSKGIDDCKEAINLNTNSPGAYNNLAWLLAVCPDAKLRNGQKALEYAKKACELNAWKEPHGLGTLAAAYAEVGNFEEAVKWQKKCMESGLPGNETKQAQKQLDLYQQKKPYHDLNKSL
jgi:tetratricopeptide (TPR) repeat protein